MRYAIRPRDQIWSSAVHRFRRYRQWREMRAICPCNRHRDSVRRWRHWRMMDLIRREFVSNSDAMQRVLLCATRMVNRFGIRWWIEPEEVVSCVVECCLSGRRHWRYPRKRTLIAFLCLVVVRTTMNEAKKSGKRRRDLSIEDDMKKLENVTEADSFEKALIADDFAKALVDSITDPLLREFARLRLVEPFQHDAWYAAQLQQPVTTIESFKKRLRKIAVAWIPRPPAPRVRGM